MLNKLQDQLPEKIPSLNTIAKEISVKMPVFVRYMYPYLYRSIDVPPAQVLTMISIEEEGACNLTSLRTKMRVSAPTMTGLVDRLVKRGYVKRASDKTDRRVINCQLTKSGEMVVKRFRNNIMDRWKVILKGFSPEERMGPLLFVNQVIKDVTMKASKTLIVIGIVLTNFLPMSFAESDIKEYRMSLEEVTTLAINNNFDIQLAEYDANIAKTARGVTESIFDTMLDAEIKYSNNKLKSSTATETLNNDYNLGVSKKLPTGTKLSLDLDNNRLWTDSTASAKILEHESTLGLSITQELGKNFFGLKDRGDVKVTKLTIENSKYTSLDKIEQSISSVQKAYWDLVLQNQRVVIEQDMVAQSKKLYDLHQEKLKDGLVEIPEAIASEANYRNRKNQLTLAFNLVKQKTNVLKLLLNIAENDCEIIPTQDLSILNNGDALDLALKKAFENRRDYKSANNTIKSKDITLAMKKNDKWPEINLDASFKKNGLGDHFKQSITNITDEEDAYFSAELSFSFPLENSSAKANYKKAELQKAKALVELKQLERKIAVEIIDSVRNCDVYREIANNTKQIAELQAKKLEEEEKRFNLGRSDTDTLIRFQEDSIQARLAQAQANYQYHVALVDLHQKTATLLQGYFSEEM